MKKNTYSLVKSIRIAALIIPIPVTLLNIATFNYPFDIVCRKLIYGSICTLIPFILTENFVVRLQYDQNNNNLYITKFNFLGGLKTTKHDISNIFKVRKNKMRPFIYFRDKKTREYFSTEHICEIKQTELFNNLIKEEKLKKKGRSAIKRLIDERLENAKRIRTNANKLLIGYTIIICLIVYLVRKNYSKTDNNSNNNNNIK